MLPVHDLPGRPGCLLDQHVAAVNVGLRAIKQRLIILLGRHLLTELGLEPTRVDHGENVAPFDVLPVLGSIWRASPKTPLCMLIVL